MGDLQNNQTSVELHAISWTDGTKMSNYLKENMVKLEDKKEKQGLSRSHDLTSPQLHHTEPSKL